MKSISAIGGTIHLGHQGENLATRVRFPAVPWREAYGEGTFQLLAQREGDAAPYPVSVTADREYVWWDVSDADTAVAGLGRCELQYFVGDVLAKSQVWLTKVAPALSPPGNPPEPYTNWVEQVLRAGADVAAVRAEIGNIDALLQTI